MKTERAPEHNRIEALDSLRGIAALLVLVFHVRYIHKLPINSVLDFVVAKFSLGVPLFFVLSSFSIFYSLEGKPFSINSVREYFVRRFFRIVPLYYFLLIIYFFYRSQSLFSIEYLSTLYLNMTFTFGFSPVNHEGLVAAGWSIGIEFIIYFILPILFCLIRNYRDAIIALCIVLPVSLILSHEYVTKSYSGIGYSYKNLSIMLPFFFLGIAVYYLYTTNNLYSIISRKKYALLLLSLIGIGLIYAIFYYQSHYHNGYVNLIKSTRLFVYSAMFLFLFVILLQLSNPIALLHNKFFNYVGKWSYSVYLVHPLIIFSSKKLYQFIYALCPYNTAAFIICFMYTLIVVVILSYFSFKYIETPGINYGKKLIHKLRNKTEPVVGN